MTDAGSRARLFVMLQCVAPLSNLLSVSESWMFKIKGSLCRNEERMDFPGVVTFL